MVTVARWNRWHEETDLEMMRRVGHTGGRADAGSVQLPRRRRARVGLPS